MHITTDKALRLAMRALAIGCRQTVAVCAVLDEEYGEGEGERIYKLADELEADTDAEVMGFAAHINAGELLLFAEKDIEAEGMPTTGREAATLAAAAMREAKRSRRLKGQG